MTLVELLLTIGGIASLLVGYYQAYRLRDALGSGSVKEAWDVLSVFILVFVVGYIGFAGKLVFDFSWMNAETLTAGVFFMGAVFVALTAYYNRKAFTDV
ncbi:MAG: hypothetical protein ABEJ93_04275 [Candidatus Nanohalobium sp.]